MKKLKLDLDALRVDTFDPAFTEQGDGTVFGGQIVTGPTCLTCGFSCAVTCGPSCYVTCQFTCYRTCQGGTCQVTCQLTCPLTCAASCFTCGFTCDPVRCGGPTGPICG